MHLHHHGPGRVAQYPSVLGGLHPQLYPHLRLLALTPLRTPVALLLRQGVLINLPWAMLSSLRHMLSPIKAPIMFFYKFSITTTDPGASSTLLIRTRCGYGTGTKMRRSPRTLSGGWNEIWAKKGVRSKSSMVPIMPSCTKAPLLLKFWSVSESTHVLVSRSSCR